MDSIITEARALDIVGEFCREITTIEDSILAVYLVGSLGGGYYRPGQSDIDTVIIVKDDAKITQAKMDEIAERYHIKYAIPKGFGSVMIREHELYPPYRKSEDEEFEFGVEIARLKVQGKPAWSNYPLSAVPMPTKELLIDDARIFENWSWREFSPAHQKLSMTACVNSILMIMRRYLMIEHGVFEFNKFKIIRTYRSHAPAIINEKAFELIERYLYSETFCETELDALREFHAEINHYYNLKLLGFKTSKSGLLLRPVIHADLPAIYDYRAEFLENGDSMDGTSNLRVYNNPEEWYRFITLSADPRTCRADWGPDTQYVCLRREDNRIVGMLDIRDRLNEECLHYYGHVGYSVRCSERRKGYATEMLAMAKEICRVKGIGRMLVTCVKENEASARTIRKCGGVIENEIFDPNDHSITQRYWIETSR
ncbi:MAG: GNAT family N-acetyltransferase [Clostridia bacterium]|nr:GNAT family N-acetyltransferase [Clostridia bacterium]